MYRTIEKRIAIELRKRLASMSATTIPDDLEELPVVEHEPGQVARITRTVDWIW